MAPRNDFREGLSAGARRFVARRHTPYDLRTSHFRAHCLFWVVLFSYEHPCAESDTLLAPGQRA